MSTEHKPFPQSYLYAAMRHIERNTDMEPSDEDQAAMDAGEMQDTNFRRNPAHVRKAAYGPPMADILTRIIEVYDAGADVSFLIEEARAILDKVNPPPARGES